MWTLIRDRPRSGAENMAVDAALLDQSEQTGQAFLRCYQWDPHCLSFGRHEPALKRYDVDRIRSGKIPCVRRPTGGRAVWHAEELTYAVAAPISVFGGMREAYAAIHGLLVAALGGLGARATLAPAHGRTPGLASGPCFAAPVGGEVLIGGMKVVGSAQLRVGKTLLQHGSLLLGNDQRLVRDLAGLAADPPAEAALDALLHRSVPWSAAADALLDATAALFGDVELTDSLPAPVEAGLAPHLERFRSDAWTWQR